MRSSELDHVTVELDAAELSGPVDIGVLRRTRAARGSIVGFAYSDDWLARKDPFPIDPLHGLYPGDQWPRDGKIDRIFSDAATDRWGRTLLSRQEAHAARTEKRPRQTLDEWDYLLGISDVSRMGALRLRAPDGRYVDDGDKVPPMTRLPDLIAAAHEIESPSRDPRRQAQSLALLLAPGSSLGGARPKASFLDQDGSLWIAKFPSRTDTRDMAACEWVMNELANAAGIEVPEHRLLEVGTGHHSFLARRFDRAGDSRRLYASAMTLVSRRDREEASYLDIALAIADRGGRSAIEAELTAMFRRVVFNVLTAHRDDHLRNHGFLRTRTGWFLAPAFDLNAMPEMPEHTLAIDTADHIGDIDLVLSTAEFYRLSSAQAEAVVDEVRAALVGWERTAKSGKLGPYEMDTIAEAVGA
jgi:serine/threonine-protein kinase HipA